MEVKKSLIKLCALLFLALAQPSLAHSDDFDDLDVEMENLDLDIDRLDEQQREREANRAPIGIGSAGQLGAFFETIGLTEPLWISTKPEKGRDILYLMPSKITSIEYGGGSCNLFFNMTPKMHLTGSNLLNIDQVNSQQLGALLAAAPLTINNPDQVGLLLPFLKKITIQERKVGPYFQFGLVHKSFLLQLHTSLQMGERNFWLNKHDQDEIKALNQLIFGESQQYDERNLYKIRAGMGDTRVKIGLNALNAKKIQTDVGLECIIPTSRSTRKFLPETSDAPLTDDATVFDLTTNGLLTVRDYLLNPELGNGGHFGLGFFLESKINLFSNLVELITRASFDKFFAADEQRLMLQKKTLTAGSLLLDPRIPGNTDALAQSLVVDFAKQYLIPFPYHVSIEPGGIFNGIMILHIPYKKWDLRYGYDFYFQQAERFKQIYASQDVLPLLDSERAHLGTVIQHKISSETTYRIKNFNNINLDIGLGGDTTISAHNIGKDWTIYLKFASEF